MKDRNFISAMAFFAAVGVNSVFAGAMGVSCTPGSVGLPCPAKAWDVGVDALYLQIREGSPGFVGFVQNGPISRWVLVEPDWSWGFKLNGSYHFRTGNDLTANWLHLKHTTSRTYTFSDFQNPSTLNQVPSSDNRQWDLVNLELGQQVNFGNYTKLRFHGGAQYALVKANVYFPNFAGNLTQTYVEHKFSGFGPRAGFDYNYLISGGLSVYAKGAAAIIAGSASHDVNVYANNLNVRGSRASKFHYVPELEGKLGANYVFNLSRGDLTLDVGYMWIDLRGAFIPPSFTTPIVRECTVSMRGPYAGVKWLGFL